MDNIIYRFVRICLRSLDADFFRFKISYFVILLLLILNYKIRPLHQTLEFISELWKKIFLDFRFCYFVILLLLILNFKIKSLHQTLYL